MVDLNLVSLLRVTLRISPFNFVYAFPEHAAVVKTYRLPDAERTCKITPLAGGCVVPSTGCLFQNPEKPAIVGLSMRLETPRLDPASIASKEERVGIIYKLRDLLAELHSKNIIHGDITPTNILRCADRRLRLCDFDNASVEGDSDGFVCTRRTLPYYNRDMKTRL